MPFGVEVADGGGDESPTSSLLVGGRRPFSTLMGGESMFEQAGQIVLLLNGMKGMVESQLVQVVVRLRGLARRWLFFDVMVVRRVGICIDKRKRPKKRFWPKECM